METELYTSEQRPKKERCVVALGFFDGVHAAHRALISSAREIASGLGLPLTVFTFPAESPVKGGTDRIYPTDVRLELFASLGADRTVLCDFRSVSSASPEEFVSEILVSELDAAVAVAGFNYRFGRGASGDANTLVALMRSHGRDAVIHDELTSGGRTVSATEIRKAIADGDVKRAEELLSLPYFIKGKVAHGRTDGRRLGYPTVNMSLAEGFVVPRHGVYKTVVVTGKKRYTGLTNVGVCPTLGAREAHAETYILDFSGDLYGSEVTVYFIDFIRDEKRFSSAEELCSQIAEDIKIATEGK